MALHSDNLFTMIGRVRNVKPNAQPEQIRTWINDAIREVINKRTYWADLGRRGIISCPDAYATGTVTLTTGSNVVAGSGTLWPIVDQVNTALSEDIIGGAPVEVALNSMVGVSEDMILLFDGGQPTEEAVAVIRKTPTTIVGEFLYAHNAGCTVTSSSLAGRQLRMGSGYPTFTVLAVRDASTLLIDNPWGGPALAAAYQILKIYYTLFTNIRHLHCAVDQKQGWPLETLRISQAVLSAIDPQRMDAGDPRALVPLTPSPARNMQVEIWPAPSSARQIAFLASTQWPELVDQNDLPPPFLDPTLFTYRASEKALRTRVAKEDPWFDPRLAQSYEKDFLGGLSDAMNNDEDRHSMDYTIQSRAMMGALSFNFMQNHVLDALTDGF